MTQPKLEIHYADEWAALYVDGKLERVGDSYLAEERAFEILHASDGGNDPRTQGAAPASSVSGRSAAASKPFSRHVIALVDDLR